MTAAIPHHRKDAFMLISRRVQILLPVVFLLAAYSTGRSPAAPPASLGTPQIRDNRTEIDSPPPISQKQRRIIVRANFEKMKQDADEILALAKSLQEQVNKSNANVLSLDVVNKAEKIEKLARRVKETARGY